MPAISGHWVRRTRLRAGLVCWVVAMLLLVLIALAYTGAAATPNTAFFAIMLVAFVFWLLAVLCASMTLALKKAYAMILVTIAWGLVGIFIDEVALYNWRLPLFRYPQVLVPGIVWVHIALTVVVMALYWHRRLRPI